MKVYSIFKKNKKKEEKQPYKRYANKLSYRHPRFKRLINLIGPLPYTVPVWSSVNDAILYATVGQMLSVSATTSIIKKLLEEFSTSAKVISWATKSCKKSGPDKGLSQRKRRTLTEWSKHLKRTGNKYLKWTDMSLDEYRRDITSIWGLGPWAADMVAIFYLGRMDVWPVQDMGIQRACQIVLKTRDTVKIQKYVSGCETVAALYLWELLNKKLNNDFDGNSRG